MTGIRSKQRERLDVRCRSRGPGGNVRQLMAAPGLPRVRTVSCREAASIAFARHGLASPEPRSPVQQNSLSSIGKSIAARSASPGLAETERRAGLQCFGTVRAPPPRRKGSRNLASPSVRERHVRILGHEGIIVKISADHEPDPGRDLPSPNGVILVLFAESDGAMAIHAAVEPGFARAPSVDAEPPARDQARHRPGGCNVQGTPFRAVRLPGRARSAPDACATREPATRRDAPREGQLKPRPVEGRLQTLAQQRCALCSAVSPDTAFTGTVDKPYRLISSVDIQ